MTNRGFDLGDNLQSQQDDNNAAETHLALLDSAGMLERVSQNDKTAQSDKTAGQTPQGETEAQRQYIAAEAEWHAALEAGKNPKEALQALGPKFEQSIATADTAYGQIEQTMKTEGPRLRQAYQAATERVEQANGRYATAFGNVPEAEQEKVDALMNAYVLLDRNDPVARAIRTSMAKYPDLTAAADAVKTASNDPTIKRVDELTTRFQTALQDRVLLRMAYGENLAQNGFDDKAWEYVKQAGEIMGIPMPDKKPLPPGTIEARYQRQA
jgi:hypothetical protein